MSFKRKQSSLHKELRTPKYRQRVCSLKNKYVRKEKHPNRVIF